MAENKKSVLYLRNNNYLFLQMKLLKADLDAYVRVTKEGEILSPGDTLQLKQLTTKLPVHT